LIDWRLCQTYHCLPSALDAEDWLRLQDHGIVRSIEAEVAEQVKKERNGRK
jgi:hypothetical protein